MASRWHTLEHVSDPNAWDTTVARAGGHLLQSWAWGQLKATFGWRAGRLAAGGFRAQVLYRALPAGLGTIAYVPRGPVADHPGLWDDGVSLQAFLASIRPALRRRRAVCLTIEPDLDDSPQRAALLHAAGLRPAPRTIQPRRTLVVDLGGEPDEVLGRMKQKTRYNVRLAGRKGVTVRPGTDGDLPAVYRLMEVTAERDGFGIHSRAYYETAHRLFVPTGYGQLLLAEYEGQLLAALVVFAFGDMAIYLYGASADEGRNRMPTYLLQWEAMQWARARGCRSYDLWGVPDQDEEALQAAFTERSDGLWGVYRFKRGFGGRLVRTVGAWDLVYAPLRYRLYERALAWLAWRDAG